MVYFYVAKALVLNFLLFRGSFKAGERDIGFAEGTVFFTDWTNSRR